LGYRTSAARATCLGCGGILAIRADFCRCTGARFWRSCHQSRVNERSESNRRHQASLSTFEVQGAAGRAAAIARCSVRRRHASCSSLDLLKTPSVSVARSGPKKSQGEIISRSALPPRTLERPRERVSIFKFKLSSLNVPTTTRTGQYILNLPNFPPPPPPPG